MKLNKNFIHSRSFRYGSVSVAVTAFVIAAVILVNVIFTSLAHRFLWYIDMTNDELFTLSDNCKDLIEDSFDKVEEKNGEGAKVNITFCSDPDTLEDNELQRYVYHTALELSDAFPQNITVSWVDIQTNPTAVNKYKTSPTERIYTSDVIVESGSEFRVYQLAAFYMFGTSDTTTPWAYAGERRFAIGIISVIQAESPIACITLNHGEAFYDYEFLYLLRDAGYKVQYIDLLHDEIPDDCRLMVIYNPTQDFTVVDGVSEISEIEKLDEWLDESNSLMVFTSPTTPKLPNLEEYLDEWGITFQRYTDDLGDEYNYTVKDTTQSLTADGYTIVGNYTTEGLGASITSDMRSVSYSPKVIFKNTGSIAYSDRYTLKQYDSSKDSEAVTANGEPVTYWYGYYYSNTVERYIYDVFTSSTSASAYANGSKVAGASYQGEFKLMTITKEQKMIQDTNYTTQDNCSYVIACTSTEFATSDLLQSSVYGNSDVLLSALHSIGREIVGVGLTFTVFSSTEMESITTAEATRYTLVLTIVPAVIVFGLGIFVVIRRKYA